MGLHGRDMEMAGHKEDAENILFNYCMMTGAVPGLYIDWASGLYWTVVVRSEAQEP